MKTHKTILKIIAASICLLGTALVSQGATIVMDEANSSRIFSTAQNGSGTTLGGGTLYVGTKNNQNGFDGHAGYAFQMTGASATDILSFANFSVSYTGIQTAVPPYDVDVYVNRVASTSTFLVSDFENGTKIMDDFVIQSDPTGNYSLDAGGQANLLNYLQTNWVENEYVFITLKANTDPNFIMGEDANANYQFGSVGNTDAQLTVSIATPEPSTLGLFAMGAGLLAARRRNRTINLDTNQNA